MTARLITSTVPFEWVDGSAGVAWSVDPAGIAAVDSRGRVTPLASGSVQIIATYGHLTSFNSIRVLPGYAGGWTGDERITGCTGFPDPRTCGRNMFDISTGNPLRYPIALALVQDRDQITGTLERTSPTGSNRITSSTTLTGFVRLNGELVLEGEVPNPGLAPSRIFNWSSSISGNPVRLSGGYTTAGEGIVFSLRYFWRTEREFIGLYRAP
jgi:hypothetical protein